MSAAMDALRTARTELVAATPNKGGHREKAIQLVNQAIEETRMGIDSARETRQKKGPARGPFSLRRTPQTPI
jgi:hypothetical protein